MSHRPAKWAGCTVLQKLSYCVKVLDSVEECNTFFESGNFVLHLLNFPGLLNVADV